VRVLLSATSCSRLATRQNSVTPRQAIARRERVRVLLSATSCSGLGDPADSVVPKWARSSIGRAADS
jgi:hypothetical protein